MVIRDISAVWTGDSFAENCGEAVASHSDGCF
jgi:hypothetical protein